MRRSVFVVPAAALFLAACGNGGSGTETVATVASIPTATQSSSSTTPPPTAAKPASADPKILQEFAEAVGSYSDPDAVRAALILTTPGSPAYVYVSHLANTSEAALDGGAPLPDQTTEKIDDSEFKACDDPTDKKTCITFGGFKVDASGKLVDLTVSQKLISDRLTAGSGEQVTSAGNKFTFLTAYKSIQSGALFVSVKVEAGAKPISPNTFSATYRSPDGKQREATTAYGPVDIDAKSNAMVTMVFQGVQPGGKVTLDGCISDCMSQFKAVIKVG